MKTVLRMLVLGGGVFVVALCLGSKEDETKADVPPNVTTSTALEAAAAPAENPIEAPKPADPKSTDVILAGASTNSLAGTNAAAGTNLVGLKHPINLIIGPTVPESLKLSKQMSDMVKLVQAGVSEQILMAYVASAGDPFEAGSDEIIYLNDLGVSANVITAILQHDSTAEMQARKQVLNAVQPLPPGVALNTPATNIYTPKETMQQPVQSPPEPVQADSAGTGSGTVLPVIQTVPAYSTDEAVGTYDTAETTTTINYNYWYSNLAPYGSWVSVGGYGSCWRPTVAVCNSAWRPYANSGRWLWSNSGWYWYSDYSWGWGPFHYGRWACPPGVGWVWVPGSTWGPAWVSWRSTPSYCGWAPLPPAARYGYGSGFYYNGASVGVGCDFGLAASTYVFLPVNRFCDRRPYNYYVSGGHGHAVYKDSTVVNNYSVGKNKTVINHGIGVERVAQATRGNIRQVALKDTTSVRDLGMRREQLTGDGATLAVHRPDASTIARIGSLTPATKPAVARPGAIRPGGPTPARGEGIAVRNADSVFNQARLTQPSASVAVPGGGASVTRPGSRVFERPATAAPGAAFSGTGVASRDVPSPQSGPSTAPTGSPASPNAAASAPRSGRSSIVMRNPNPGRNNANRPVTYPYVPATQSPAAGLARPTSPRPGAPVTSPGPSAPIAPRSSFVPGPPAPAPRVTYNYNAPQSRSVAPAPDYSARPSHPSRVAGPSPRIESPQPAVSAPSPSRSGGDSSPGKSDGGSSSGRSSNGGSVSPGGGFQVGRGR